MRDVCTTLVVDTARGSPTRASITPPTYLVFEGRHRGHPAPGPPTSDWIYLGSALELAAKARQLALLLLVERRERIADPARVAGEQLLDDPAGRLGEGQDEG